ncbi:hypothetical protein ABE527_10145 [Brucella sp. TWI432]
MPSTLRVPDRNLIGKKGYPRNYEALGIEPPMKIVPVEDGVPVESYPGLGPADVYRLEIQAMIDAKARERQYDNGSTLASYVNSTIKQWSIEAQSFVAWRDAVWLYALSELDKVQKGERDQPTIKKFMAELPAFGWPLASATPPT